MQFASLINWRDLRSWEYWEADSHEMYWTMAMKAAWEEGKQNGRAQVESMNEAQAG